MTKAQVDALWARIKTIFAEKTELDDKQDALIAGRGISIDDNVISSTLDTDIFVIVDELPYSYSLQNLFENYTGYVNSASIDENGEVQNGYPTCVVCEYDISNRGVLNGINLPNDEHAYVDTHTLLYVAFYDSNGRFISGVHAPTETSQSTIQFPQYVIIPDYAKSVKIVWSQARPRIQCGLATPTGQENKIYVVQSEEQGSDNHYTEYVLVDGKYEKFGEFHADVDLSSYYQKPAAGIPKEDLTSSVQTSLTKADTALQNESVFISMYGTTTFNAVNQAINAGKTVGCKYSGDVAWMSAHTETEILFTLVKTNSIYAITLQRSYSTWSVVSNPIGNTTISQDVQTGETVIGVNGSSHTVVSTEKPLGSSQSYVAPSWGAVESMVADDYTYIVDLSVDDLLASPLASTTIAKLTTMRNDTESQGKLILFYGGSGKEHGSTTIPATITQYGSQFDMYLYYDGKNIHVTSDPTSTTWEVTQSDLEDESVFVAEYGVTTYADISAAYDDGKAVFVKDGNYTMPLTQKAANGIFYFACPNFNDYVWWCYVNPSNGWVHTGYNIELGDNKKNTITGNESSTTYYPSTKAVADYVSGIVGNINTILDEINGEVI